MENVINMTREDKIEEALKNFIENNSLNKALYDDPYEYFCKAFKIGAKWADKNKESWIDVDEELPYERSELVIDYNTFKITPWVFTHYPNDTFGITKMIYENDTWRWLSPGNVSIIKPNYWMPIPNLPN